MVCALYFWRSASGLLKGKLGQSNLPSTHLLYFVVVFFLLLLFLFCFFVVVFCFVLFFVVFFFVFCCFLGFFFFDNLSKCQWSFAKLYVCIEIVEIWFGIANGQVLSILTRSSARDMIVAGYYRFAFLLATFVLIYILQTRPHSPYNVAKCHNFIALDIR